MDQDEPVPAPAPTDVSKLTDAQRAERQAAMDRLVPGLDPSEYGRMPPSFHSNSQRVAPATVEADAHDALDAAASSVLPPRPVRPPILPRDKFDGVDSDDDTDEDPVEDEEDEEEQPQVVGEVDIDMADEEEEFIEFARQALGVTDEQWRSILKERSDRGGGRWLSYPFTLPQCSKQLSRPPMFLARDSKLRTKPSILKLPTMHVSRWTRLRP